MIGVREDKIVRQAKCGWAARAALCASLAFVLVACGGGGGEVLQPGRQTPLTITAANAIDVADAALNYGGLALASGNVAVDWLEQLEASGAVLQAGACLTGGTQRLALVDRDGNGRPSPGDRLDVTLDGCYLRALDEAFYGSVTLEIGAPGAGQRWVADLAFGQDFGLAPGSVNIRLEGGLRVEYSTDRLSKVVRVRSSAQSFGVSGQSGAQVLRDVVTLLDARREVRRDTARATSTMTHHLASDLLGGSIDVITASNWSSWFDSFPDAGELRITGASGPGVLLRASALGQQQMDVSFGVAAVGTLSAVDTGFLWSGAGWVAPDPSGLGYRPMEAAAIGFRQIDQPAITELRPKAAPLVWAYTRPLASSAVTTGVFRRTALGPGFVWGLAEVHATVTLEGALLSVQPSTQLEPGGHYELVLDTPTFGALTDVFGASLPWPPFSAPVTNTVEASARIASPPVLLGTSATLTLDAGASSAVGAAVVSTQWRQVSGPSLNFASPGSPVTTVQASGVGNGLAVVEVEVRNGAGEFDRHQLSFPVLADTTQAMVIAFRSAGGPLTVRTSSDDSVPATYYARYFSVSNAIDALLNPYRLIAGLPAGTPWQAGTDVTFGPGAPSGAVAVWSAPGAVCNVQTGRLVLPQYDVDPAGNIARLAIDFEHSCDGAAPTFGSIRYGTELPLSL